MNLRTERQGQKNPNLAEMTLVGVILEKNSKNAMGRKMSTVSLTLSLS